MSKPGRGSDQFPLRLPDGMRDRIKSAAETNSRSMNAEIVQRLVDSFEGIRLSDELRSRIQMAAAENHRSFDIEANERLEQSFENWPKVSLPNHMMHRGMTAPLTVREEYEAELDEFAESLFRTKFPDPENIPSLIGNLIYQAIRNSKNVDEEVLLDEYFEFATPFLHRLGYRQDTMRAFMKGRYAGLWISEGRSNPYAKADDQHDAWEAGFAEGRRLLDGSDGSE